MKSTFRDFGAGIMRNMKNNVGIVMVEAGVLVGLVYELICPSRGNIGIGISS